MGAFDFLTGDQSPLRIKNWWDMGQGAAHTAAEGAVGMLPVQEITPDPTAATDALKRIASPSIADMLMPQRILSPLMKATGYEPAVPPVAQSAYESMKKIGRTPPESKDFLALAPLIFGGAGVAADAEAGGLMANRGTWQRPQWSDDMLARMEHPDIANLTHVDAAKKLTEEFGHNYSDQNVAYKRGTLGLTSPMGYFDADTQALLAKMHSAGASTGEIAQAATKASGRDVSKKSVSNWVAYQKRQTKQR